MSDFESVLPRSWKPHWSGKLHSTLICIANAARFVGHTMALKMAWVRSHHMFSQKSQTNPCLMPQTLYHHWDLSSKRRLSLKLISASFSDSRVHPRHGKNEGGCCCDAQEDAQEEGQPQALCEVFSQKKEKIDRQACWGWWAGVWPSWGDAWHVWRRAWRCETGRFIDWKDLATDPGCIDDVFLCEKCLVEGPI